MSSYDSRSRTKESSQENDLLISKEIELDLLVEFVEAFEEMMMIVKVTFSNKRGRVEELSQNSTKLVTHLA